MGVEAAHRDEDTGASQDHVDLAKCKLRVCGDYRKVNSQICKIVPNLPTGLDEVERAAGYKLMYWKSDSVACYHQFLLVKGHCREALAVWTAIGLVQPTTLPFGQRNSGTEAQGPYRAAAAEMRNGRHGNYVDDWIGWPDSEEQLCEDFAGFLSVCDKYEITLGTAKTKFGYASAQFFGFRVDIEGSHLASKHLYPLRTLVPPTNIHELRRVLGLIVVPRKYVKDFAVKTKPMTVILRGKPPTFFWGEEQQASFDFIREKLLSGIHLVAPDFSLPFHLAADASEDGKGSELYQLPDVPVEQQYPYNVKAHAPEMHAVIFFISKAWNETQRLPPPFYLEGDALLWGTLKSNHYALCSPYPLYTYSNHMPLNWMEKPEKGPISSFIIEKLSEIETVHQYIQGKVNNIPDACSRYPMLGPKQLATRGFTNSVEQMLKRLPTIFQQTVLAHLHGGRNNGELRQSLRNWVHRASALQPVTPPKKSPPATVDLAILIPRCEIAPVTLAQYLLSTVPFAMLLPVDLLTLSYSPKPYPGSPHQLIAERFQLAAKVTILETQMTWVFENMANCTPVETFANSLHTPAPVTGFTVDGDVHAAIADEDIADEVEDALPRTLETWIVAQSSAPEFGTFLETVTDKACRQQLWIYAPENASPRIIVPASCQEALIRDVHEKMYHLNHQKVAFVIERSYYWPDLRKDTRRVLADCSACELTKACQNSAHGLFRSLPTYAPRARWCMDFQGQGESLTGEKEALTLIDPMSRYVCLEKVE